MIKANLPTSLPPGTEGRDNATVVAFDAEARRRTRPTPRTHRAPASASDHDFQRTAARGTIQLAAKALDEGSPSEALLHLRVATRILEDRIA